MIKPWYCVLYQRNHLYSTRSRMISEWYKLNGLRSAQEAMIPDPVPSPLQERAIVRSVKTLPKEMDGGIGRPVDGFSPGDQSRLATYGTFGLRLVLFASSCLLLPRQTRVAVPFSVLSHELSGRSPRTTHKWRIDVLFHCEESGFLADRYHFSARAPFCLWGNEGGWTFAEWKHTKRAISEMLIAGSTLILDRRIRRISSLPWRSGGPTYTKRSNRPGRMRAES